MLVLRQNEAYNIISMTDPENSSSFKAIVGNLDLRQDGIYELTSIDDFKEQMLTRLFERVKNLDIFDVADEEVYQRVCYGLSLEMCEEFMATDGLQLNDEVVSTGEMIYTVMDSKDPTVDVRSLPANFTLRGKVMGFVVTSVPDTDLIGKDLSQYHLYNPVPTVRFGLGMILCGATAGDNSRISFDEYGLTVCVPLDNEPAPVKKLAR